MDHAFENAQELFCALAILHDYDTIRMTLLFACNLQHPFVTGNSRDSHLVLRSSLLVSRFSFLAFYPLWSLDVFSIIS